MSKKIVVISTSLRNNSNSEILADSFINGAKSVGNEVEKITLKDKNIAFCKGCLACQSLGRCVINDDALGITEKIKNSDVVVWATPVYYYEMSGQMKTLIDRANSLYSSDYAFREVYLLTTAAEDENDVDSFIINGVRGWVECFDKAEFVGSVFAGGVNDGGDISGHKALQAAFDMGASIN